MAIKVSVFRDDNADMVADKFIEALRQLGIDVLWSQGSDKDDGEIVYEIGD